MLDPGLHEVADVAIHWPLHLAGGGAGAEDTVLSSAKSNDGALDFRCCRCCLCMRLIYVPSATAILITCEIH